MRFTIPHSPIMIFIKFENALKAFKAAADQGHALPRYEYADMLDNGKGTKDNKEEAFKNYKLAADQGHSRSMFMCGIKLNDGE